MDRIKHLDVFYHERKVGTLALYQRHLASMTCLRRICYRVLCVMILSIVAMSPAAIVTFDFSIKMFPPVIMYDGMTRISL